MEATISVVRLFFSCRVFPENHSSSIGIIQLRRRHEGLSGLIYARLGP